MGIMPIRPGDLDFRKGPTLREFDRQMNSLSTDDLEQLLKLAPGTSAEIAYATTKELLQNRKAPLMNEARIQHIARHWFGIGGHKDAYFLGQNAERILLAGTRKAIEQMLRGDPQGRRLPLDSYVFMTDTHSLRVVVTRSAQQVTMTIIAPRPNGTPVQDAKQEEEPTWIVGQSEVSVRQVGG